MQEWSLDHKILVTQTRLMEWYQKNNGNVYISFSGGKDSTVLLHIARKLFPDIIAVYVDTGLEYPEIREFVKTVPNVEWIKPEMSFRQVIRKYGYPLISKEASSNIHYARRAKERGDIKAYNRYALGERVNRRTGEVYSFMKLSTLAMKLVNSDIPVHSRCCQIMKKKPVHKYEKRTGRKAIIATMACESKVREQVWLKKGCNSFESIRQTSQPLSFWTEQDILAYLKKYNVPYADIYGDIIEENGVYRTTGVSRTGCMFCGYGCHLEDEPNRFQKLKISHPKIWAYIMKPIDDGGLGFKDVLEFIDVKIE